MHTISISTSPNFPFCISFQIELYSFPLPTKLKYYVYCNYTWHIHDQSEKNNLEEFTYFNTKPKPKQKKRRNDKKAPTRKIWIIRPCHGVAGRSRICASLSQVDQRGKLQSMGPSPKPGGPGVSIIFYVQGQLGHQKRRSLASYRLKKLFFLWGGGSFNWNINEHSNKYLWFMSGVFLVDASTICCYQHTKAGFSLGSIVSILTFETLWSIGFSWFVLFGIQAAAEDSARCWNATFRKRSYFWRHDGLRYHMSHRSLGNYSWCQKGSFKHDKTSGYVGSLFSAHLDLANHGISHIWRHQKRWASGCFWK